MQPWMVDLCANSLRSVIGNASMSARSPIARSPRRPRTTPTTPVPPMPRWVSMPSASRWRATSSAVRRSSKASSGWAWMSRRIAVSLLCRGRTLSMRLMAAPCCRGLSRVSECSTGGRGWILRRPQSGWGESKGDGWRDAGSRWSACIPGVVASRPQGSHGSRLASLLRAGRTVGAKQVAIGQRRMCFPSWSTSTSPGCETKRGAKFPPPRTARFRPTAQSSLGKMSSPPR